MKELKYTPRNWGMDGGLEFNNKISRQFFAKHGITQFVTKTQMKAALAENMIKHIKAKIYRYLSFNQTKKYLDILPILVKTYNNKVHSAHNHKPGSINKNMDGEIFSILYKRLIDTPRPPPVYFVGQKVRVISKRLVFKKYYKANYSQQLFKIAEIIPSYPIFTYKIATLDGEPVQSSFTSQELSAAE